MRKGLIDEEGEDCVEGFFGKAKTQTTRL